MLRLNSLTSVLTFAMLSASQREVLPMQNLYGKTLEKLDTTLTRQSAPWLQNGSVFAPVITAL